MAIESVFACSFSDCLLPCAITFVLTLVFLSIIHIIIYFQLVRMAKKRYGIEGFSDKSCYHMRHLFNIKHQPYIVI